MRVLFWSEQYAPCIGGVETVVASLAEELVRRGHEAAVITNRLPSSLPAREVRAGVLVQRFNVTSAIEQRDLRALRESCEDATVARRNFAPEVEHVHSTGPLLAAFQRARDPSPVPVVTTLHCAHDLLGPLLAARGTAAATLSRSTAVIVLSSVMRDVVLGGLPEVRGRIHIETFGPPGPAPAPAPLPLGPPVLLGLGRLVPEKGFDLALQALALLRPRFPTLRLVIAGDGPARPALEALAAGLGLLANVEFAGWVPPTEVHALLARATLVLVPSRWEEPFAVVALEAAQAGRAVVATARGGMAECVLDGVTGRVVPPDDAPALARAIGDLLAGPAGLRRMGAAARVRALDRFNFRRYFERHVELYEQAIRPNPAPA